MRALSHIEIENTALSGGSVYASIFFIFWVISTFRIEDLRAQLNEANTDLEKYRKLYGPLPTTPIQIV